jgi:S1-C subfamily serine protease
MIGLLSSTAAVNGSEASGGYALPMDPIYKRIIKVLNEGREVEYGFLGISHSPEGVMPKGGLMVANVSPNTPAKAADLRDRDIILSVDDRPIRELEDLYLLVGGSLAGTQVTLTVRREGRIVTVKPTLAKFAHPHATIASKRPESVFGLRVDYTSILQQQPMFVGERRLIRPGVIIRELEPDTPAAVKLKEIQSGKAVVITSVNGTPVQTPEEFYTTAKGAGSVRLTIANASDDGEPARTVTLP